MRAGLTTAQVERLMIWASLEISHGIAENDDNHDRVIASLDRIEPTIGLLRFLREELPTGPGGSMPAEYRKAALVLARQWRDDYKEEGGLEVEEGILIAREIIAALEGRVVLS